MKTAKLYAWVALQTLPEEMVISPCLLDFLEKALETIPITPVDRNYTSQCGFRFIICHLNHNSVRCLCVYILYADRNMCVCVALNVPEEDVGHFDSVEPLEESQVSLVSSASYPYSSFPVDVVVYVRVQVYQRFFICTH